MYLSMFANIRSLRQVCDFSNTSSLRGRFRLGGQEGGGKDNHFRQIRQTVKRNSPDDNTCCATHRQLGRASLRFLLACSRDDDLSYSRLSTLSTERRGSLTARDRTIHRRRCVAGGGSECQFREVRERRRVGESAGWRGG